MLSNDEKQLMTLVEEQAAALERCAEILQEVQARIPRPSPEDVEEVRSRQRPMNRNEYTLARLQRAVVALENVASDLRVDLEYDYEPAAYDLLEVDVNALVAAVDHKNG